MTYQGDIRERLDPDHFLALRDADFQAIKSSVFPAKKLRRLSTLVTKGESPLWRGDSFQDRGMPFLRGKNIKGEIDFDDIVHIPKDVHERMKRSVLNDDFFLLTIAGTLGDVAFFKKEYPECNINQDIAKIKLTDEIAYEYAVLYFQTRFAKSQIKILSNGTTRGHLNFSQVRSFDVIVPSPEIQNHIVEIIQSAYAQKRQKAQEADALLDSIDGYVLAELGIEMPAVEEKKCFVVSAGEIERRFDPFYLRNIPYFRSIKTPYPLTPLGKLLIEKPQYGANERAINGNPETDIRYIRITDIHAYGNLLNDDWKTAENVDEKYLLEEGDILFARSGATAGKSFAYKTEFGKAILAGYLIRFRFDETQINPLFVRYYTQTQIYKFWVRLIQRAAAQPNINAEEFKSFRIPLPPLEVQNRIVEESQRRLSEAKKLSQEADAIVEAAKKEAERMMLEGASG